MLSCENFPQIYVMNQITWLTEGIFFHFGEDYNHKSLSWRKYKRV